MSQFCWCCQTAFCVSWIKKCSFCSYQANACHCQKYHLTLVSVERLDMIGMLLLLSPWSMQQLGHTVRPKCKGIQWEGSWYILETGVLEWLMFKLCLTYSNCAVSSIKSLSIQQNILVKSTDWWLNQYKVPLFHTSILWLDFQQTSLHQMTVVIQGKPLHNIAIHWTRWILFVWWNLIPSYQRFMDENEYHEMQSIRINKRTKIPLN